MIVTIILGNIEWTPLEIIMNISSKRTYVKVNFWDTDSTENSKHTQCLKHKL